VTADNRIRLLEAQVGLQTPLHRCIKRFFYDFSRFFLIFVFHFSVKTLSNACVRFLRRGTFSMPSFEVNLLTQWHEICSQEIRESTLSYGENPESLSHLGLNRYEVVTNRTE